MNDQIEQNRTEHTFKLLQFLVTLPTHLTIYTFGDKTGYIYNG